MSTKPASPTSGGRTTAAGRAARSTPVASKPGEAQRVVHAALEQQLPGEVQRDAAEEREGVEGVQRLARTGVRQHALDAEGGQHDAGNEREVSIGVGLDGQVDPGLASRLQQSLLGRQRHHVEVQPPQADGGGHAQDGRDQQRRADGLLGGAHPDGDDRLADRQDDEQPVSF
jgi:hypothetical protein